MFAHYFTRTLDLRSPDPPAFTTPAFILLRFCMGSDPSAPILSSTNCSKALLCWWHSCFPIFPRADSLKHFFFCHFVEAGSEMRTDVWAQAVIGIQYQKLLTQKSILHSLQIYRETVVFEWFHLGSGIHCDSVFFLSLSYVLHSFLCGLSCTI